MKKFYHYIFFICLSPLLTFGQRQVISLHERAEITNVGTVSLSFEQFLEASDTLSFTKLKNENENIDFTSDHHWVRFTLENNLNDTLHYLLKTARPITDEVDLYQVSTNGNVLRLSSGDAKPFSTKNFLHRESVFRLKLGPHTTYQFYLHLGSDGEMITLPLKLYTLDAFLENSTRTEFLFGLFYGVLLIAALVYLFFFFSLKQNTFLYYGLYIIFFGLLQFTLDGYMHQYFFSDSGWLYSKIVLFTASISTILLGLYAESFLKIAERFKHLTKLYRGIYYLVGVLIVGLLVSKDFLAITYPIINGLALLLIFIIIGTIIAIWIKKEKVDPFFSLGVFFLTLGLIVFILNNFSLIPSNFITQNSSKIGGALEIIFLSLSMSNLIKKLREEKELSQEMALRQSEEANDLKLHLMSNVSHELRTPLNAIMGLATKIKKEANLDGDQTKDVEVIQHSSDMLLGSINNLLDFYKIEKNEMRLEHRVFNLPKSLEQLNTSWKTSVETKQLDFQFHLSSSLPKFVKGDETRVLQVAENLIENAIKFTQEGSIAVNAALESESETHITLNIVIEDTGIGIPTEKLKSLFKGFTQAQTDDKRAFGGLGLGLSIAKAIAELHGGSLNIDTETGKGTRCTVAIPLERVAKADEPKKNVRPNQPELPEVNILIVEDNKLNQMVVKQMLSSWKNTTYQVAENGEEALECLKQEDFHLILMDLQMPVMDGYEAAQLIRAGEVGEQYRNIPIIAVTADTTEQTKQKVKEIGINDYQSKPFTIDVLYNKVYHQLVN